MDKELRWLSDHRATVSFEMVDLFSTFDEEKPPVPIMRVVVRYPLEAGSWGEKLVAMTPLNKSSRLTDYLTEAVSALKALWDKGPPFDDGDTSAIMAANGE